MHLHFDPIGGVAGDMFIAALAHAFPEHRDGLLAAIRAAGIAESIQLRIFEHADAAMSGLRFDVIDPSAEHHHDDAPAHHQHHHHDHDHHHAHADDGHADAPSRRWSEIRAQLANSALAPPVITHAIGIFSLLADAESRVHGVSVDQIGFHEVGAADSIADIVGAAYLIDAIGARSYSCAPLPLGAGRVHTAHGMLPVPAPATALLLHGRVTIDDGRDGERVTPTGAAILRYLNPAPRAGATRRKLTRIGTGFGVKRFAGLSNVLRVLAFEPTDVDDTADTVLQIEFEIDDQTAEDLAVGLDRLRATAGVLDVVQCPVFGKKGRMLTQVRVLAELGAQTAVIDACFRETTTIGLRRQSIERTTLARRIATTRVHARDVPVKLVDRPGGPSGKTEMDALADAGDHAERQRLRQAALQAALRARND